MSVDKLVDSTQLDSDLTSVANAIRTKGGTSAQFAFPNGFVQAIDAIPTGDTLITKTITENGTYSAEDDDADGYSEVTVNVSGGGINGEFTPAERVGTYTFYAPNCTYLACIAKTAPSTSTGLAFVYAFVCRVGQYYAAQTTNGGTGIAGANSGCTITYSNDTFTLDWGNVGNITKVPQVGTTYTWCAW